MCSHTVVRCENNMNALLPAECHVAAQLSHSIWLKKSCRGMHAHEGIMKSLESECGLKVLSDNFKIFLDDNRV